MTNEPQAMMLRAARDHTGLSGAELWLRYFGIGGSAAFDRFESYFSGETIPERIQYDMLVLALNERFAEMGNGHPVPYAEETD